MITYAGLCLAFFVIPASRQGVECDKGGRNLGKKVKHESEEKTSCRE